MTTLDEALGQGPALKGVLSAGVDWLSGSQEITFALYRRNVLPLDGFIFWIRDVSVPPMTVMGSLHYATDADQREDEMAASNTVVFTAKSAVKDLNSIEPATMWIAEYQGVKIGFSSRGSYYRQADLHHYSGTGLLSALRSQVIDDGSDLDPEKLIVSNSLPAFLFLNDYEAPYPTPFQLDGMVTLFPSFCIPDNLSPPYAAVHVESSENLQAAPFLNNRTKPFALSADVVRITSYGLDNVDATLLRDTILQYSYDWNVIGIMDFSAIRDEKRPQSEFGILAQKKTMTFRVSYFQTAVRDIARQMLEKARVTCMPQNF